MESVSKAPDLVIVSAYGRGHWLAGELARQKWSVHLLDATAALGGWGPEDWEGPWGLFDLPELSPSQRSRLLDEDVAISVPSGFTLWPPQGPLELGGELATFHSRAFGVHEDVRTYLRATGDAETSLERVFEPVPTQSSEEDLEAEARDSVSRRLRSSASLWLDSLTAGVRRAPPLKGRERSHRKVSQLPFEEAWLAHFAHALAGNRYVENRDAIFAGAPLPLRAPYGVRHVTMQSFEAGLARLEAAGVRVTRNASVNDVRIHNGMVDAFEMVAQRRGVESGRAFLWMLSSHETEFLSESVARAIYPDGALRPAWAWTRFRIRVNDNSAARALPLGFAMVENIFLPWTHSNLSMIKRVHPQGSAVSDRAGFFSLDAWIRVPSRVLGDGAYFQGLRNELLAIFARRIPLSDPVCEEMPVQSDPAHSGERAILWPVYDEKARENLTVRSAKNLFVDTPEQWDGLDWSSQMRSQRAVLSALEKLRSRWQANDRRQEVRA